MSNQSHVETTHWARRRTNTRRQFLAALGAGSLAGAVWSAYQNASVEPRDEAMRTSDHEIRIDGRTTEVRIAVPEARYQRVSDADHSFSKGFAAAQHQSYLAPVVAGITERASGRASAIRAVQSLAARITYVPDEDATGAVEFVRYPAETLVDGCGDCEDKAILLAGLLSRPPLDCRTALLVVPGHCATLAARADLPRELLAPDPVAVTLGDTEYVYVEAVESVQPGRAARDYGDRPRVAAFDGHWTVLDADALLEWTGELYDRHGYQLARIASSGLPGPT